MSEEKTSQALARELGPNATSDYALKLLRYVQQWEEDRNPHWVDLAVVEVIDAQQLMPPALQRAAGQAAKIRLALPGHNYDGYMVHLAESALDQDPTERGPIDAIWRAAAENKLPTEDAAEWMSIIAKRVVKQVIDFEGPTKGRQLAAIAALGLRGPIDKLYEHRRAVELFLDFHPLAKVAEPRRSWPETLYWAMKSHYEGVPKVAVKKRLDNLVKSLKKSR
jgi:hypothetical protein